jgi:hypothetical protein
MPRVSIDYSKTVIYKIVCNDLEIKDIYVGHTTDFIRRKGQHKYKCQKGTFKIYETIRNNGGWDNWCMIEIEKYTCNDSNEAASRERYWYETLQANLNVLCPNRTQKEYTEINREKIKEYQQQYNIDNKEQLDIQKKMYRDCHKDINKEKTKIWYSENVEKAKAKQNEEVMCECGCAVARRNIARHKKTPKHIQHVNNA